ncbi:hypothetical protein V757_11435 [Pelistega indica]|uniref:Uncharacterized protein n=1 Tax=Pelistega indica TaxID=1414851 RepID=V8FTF4_9BURK|nr:hypothetical protein [Pelistega indica]ETD67430.1 hypothetical protein V757_11435 [Pelistega indica]
MDGSPILLNDLVWDLLLGTGKVVAINADGSFDVEFGTRQATYQAGGMLAGVKRLYWANPIQFVPPKQETKKWQIIKNVIELLKREL